MLRALIYAAIAALIVWAVITGINNFFHSLPAKDRALAAAVLRNMRTSELFRDNIIDFRLVEPGIYRCDTRGLGDAHEAGKFAYNSMVLLSERNDNVIITGRSMFTIYGYQDGVLIFEVTYSYGPGQMPRVTLHGPFEGVEYIPSFRGSCDPAGRERQPSPGEPPSFVDRLS